MRFEMTTNDRNWYGTGDGKLDLPDPHPNRFSNVANNANLIRRYYGRELIVEYKKILKI